MGQVGKGSLGEVLEKAEGELRQLIAQEAERGRYAEITSIAHAADVLSRLRSNGNISEAESLAPTRLSHARLAAARARATTAAQESSAPSNEFGRAETNKKYPRFHREGARLVKTSWSKTTDSEYEHKAGKAVLDAVADSLLKLALKKKRFSVEELGRVRLDSGGPVIPSYQVYLCIAWLRAEGILEQSGRDGYSLLNKNDFRETVDKKWAGLDEVPASE